MKLVTISLLLALCTTQAASQCEAEGDDPCNNKEAAMPLKVIAIFSILASSVIGVGLPLVTQNIPALSPNGKLFVIVKSFASGIILATAFRAYVAVLLGAGGMSVLAKWA